MPKNSRGSIAKATASLEDMVKARKLGWTFSDGRTLELDLVRQYSGFDSMPEAAQFQFGRGGFEKVRDSYAGSESVAEAYETASAVIDELLAGRWFRARTVGPRLGELYEAAKRVLTRAGKPVPTVEAFNTKYADETARNNLRDMAQIKSELAQIAKEKAELKATELANAAAQSTTNLDSI